MIGFLFAISCQPEVVQESLCYLANGVPNGMQKLNYSWNQRRLSLWFCNWVFLCTCNVCSGSLKGFLSLCCVAAHTFPAWRAERQSLLTTPLVTFASMEKHFPRTKQDTSLRCPFESLQSRKVRFTSEATFLTKQRAVLRHYHEC